MLALSEDARARRSASADEDPLAETMRPTTALRQDSEDVAFSLEGDFHGGTSEFRIFL